MEKIIIIGGRGTPSVIADQICDASDRFGQDIEVLGFALDDLSNGDHINGFPILCPIKKLYEKYGSYNDVKFIYSLYRSDVIKERTKLLYSLDIPLEKFTNFIHPSALIARSATIGHGNVFLANTVINNNVNIKNFNTFHSNVLIAHDSVIGNNNFFAGHVTFAGHVSIKDENFLGANTSVKNYIQIGSNNIIGMASNIVKSVGDSKMLYGNPAKEKTK